MRYKNIDISKRGTATIVMLNRPEKLNALDGDTLESLGKAIKDVSQESCRGVIITGAGGKAFCAGGDIRYLSSLNTSEMVSSFVNTVHKLYDSIENLKKPVVAAIDGYCFGGGCELALSCDMRIATKDSTFGQPEVKIGIMPGGGGTYRLPATVGVSKAKEMIMTGNPISAEEALGIGLINRIVDKGSLLDVAVRMVDGINSNSFNAVRKAKAAINSTLKANEAIERELFVECFTHPDRAEGMDAFLNKRKPEFA